MLQYLKYVAQSEQQIIKNLLWSSYFLVAYLVQDTRFQNTEEHKVFWFREVQLCHRAVKGKGLHSSINQRLSLQKFQYKSELKLELKLQVASAKQKEGRFQQTNDVW